MIERQILERAKIAQGYFLKTTTVKSTDMCKEVVDELAPEGDLEQ
jgi:hypothetical protein